MAELRLVAEHLIPDFDVRDGAGRYESHALLSKKVKKKLNLSKKRK